MPNLIAEFVPISPSYYLLYFPQWKATPFRSQGNQKNSVLDNYQLKLYCMSNGTGDNKKTLSSWYCRNCCWLAFVLWFGYCLLTLESFVYFVSSHLVITPSTTIDNTNKLNFHSLFFLDQQDRIKIEVIERCRSAVLVTGWSSTRAKQKALESN